MGRPCRSAQFSFIARLQPGARARTSVLARQLRGTHAKFRLKCAWRRISV